VFQGCSDGVESRVEQAILDAELWGVQLRVRIRNSPDALALGDAGLLTNDSMWRAGPSIDELSELSIDRRN
jgi:hypothetical protein